MMVEPTHFFFNTETAKDNEFMTEVDEDSSIVSKKAIQEHRDLSKAIQDAGISVVKYQQQADDLPDSLFPNNWISSHYYPTNLDKKLVCIYPMKAPSRQREVNSKIVEDLAGESGTVIDMTHYTELNIALEGTGVLIFDAPNSKIYANISQRCDMEALNHFLEVFNSH